MATGVGPRLARLDDTKFRHELAIRGITARQLAAQAGISEVTVARVRRAARVSPRTLLRLAIALSKIPINEQLVKILPDLPDVVPTKKMTAAAARDGRRGGSSASSTRRR